MKESEVLKGIGLSPGVVRGKVVVLHSVRGGVAEKRIGTKRVEREIKRFLRTLRQAKNDLESLKNRVSGDTQQEVVDILDVYMLFMEDPSFVDNVIDKIKKGFGAEYAVKKVFDEVRRKLKASEDPYLRERARDIKCVKRFLLNKLEEREVNWEEILKEGNIIVTPFISPVDLIYISSKGIKGVVIERGSQVSHTTILARAMGIPMVRLADASELLETGEEVVVDGTSGLVVVNPVKEYVPEDSTSEAVFICKEPVTQDGIEIEIYANIDYPEEAKAVRDMGAKGVGIFRTEYMYMISPSWPDENFQYEYMRRLIEYAAGMPLVVRIADLGKDKVPFYAEHLQDLVDYRGIKFFLKHEDVFRTHIRGILRAFSNIELNLLIPMVSDTYEVKWVRNIVEEELKNIDEKPSNIALGAMIETPAGVLVAREIADHVDFVSVGTNDLNGLLHGIDREAELMDYMLPPRHLSLMKAISLIVRSCKEAGIELTICGEAARDERFLPFFISLGVRKISINPAFISSVAEFISGLNVEKIKEEIDWDRFRL